MPKLVIKPALAERGIQPEGEAGPKPPANKKAVAVLAAPIERVDDAELLAREVRASKKLVNAKGTKEILEARNELIEIQNARKRRMPLQGFFSLQRIRGERRYSRGQDTRYKRRNSGQTNRPTT